MERYNTILDGIETEITEKKSKFIANLYPVENIEQAEEFIKKIKKKYFDAKHNCIAYRIQKDGQIIEKSSDDGEPSGTAGAPMLSILQKNNLCNVIIVVTRYFGGILLGTGGLVRAYSDSILIAIQKSTIVKKVEGIELILKIDYSYLEIFKNYCKNNDIKITNLEFKEDITLKIEMEKNRKNVFDKDIEDKMLKIKEIEGLQEKYIDKIVGNK